MNSISYAMSLPNTHILEKQRLINVLAKTLFHLGQCVALVCAKWDTLP
jgi:hypothetical protein